VVVVVFDVFSVADTVSKADGGTFDGNVTMAGTLAVTGNGTVGGTLGVTGAVTADAGVSIDNITIDGTEIDLSSGDLTIDVAGDINLDADGGDIFFKDGGTSFGRASKLTNDFALMTQVNDAGMLFYTTPSGSATERFRIRSGGFVRQSSNLGVSSHSRLSTSTANVFHSDTTGSIMFFLENTSADPYGLMMDFSQAAADDNTNHFLKLEDSSAERCIIYSDGDVKNHDNSYGSLSDERIKDNITDAKSQWDDIKALKVRNFQLKDDIRQYGADKAKSMIGVVAQEVESAGMNGLIKHADPNKGNVLSDSAFGTVYKDGDDIPDGKAVGDVKEVKEKVKGVSYSVLYMKAIKALQEAMTRIEALEADVKALKGE
jgi:hypothetical protein